MATSTCFSPLRGRTLRITKVDGCGKPIVGPDAFVVTESFTSVKYTLEKEDGAEINKKTAGGKICVADKAPDVIKWINFEVTLCAVDPDLVTLFNPKWRKELDEKGNTNGWRITADTMLDQGFAVELWTDVQGADSCDDPDAKGQWDYILLPWVVGGIMGDMEIGSEAPDFVFSGRGKIGSRWGYGPHNVVQKDTKPHPLLVPFGRDELMIPSLITTLPPPEAKCGGQELTPVTPPAAMTIKAEQDGTTKAKYTFTIENAPFPNVSLDFGDGKTEPETAVKGKVENIVHTYTEVPKTGKAVASSGAAQAEAPITKIT